MSGIMTGLGDFFGLDGKFGGFNMNNSSAYSANNIGGALNSALDFSGKGVPGSKYVYSDSVGGINPDDRMLTSSHLLNPETTVDGLAKKVSNVGTPYSTGDWAKLGIGALGSYLNYANAKDTLAIQQGQLDDTREKTEMLKDEAANTKAVRGQLGSAF